MSLTNRHSCQMQVAKTHLSEFLNGAVTERALQQVVEPTEESFASFLSHAPKTNASFPERRFDDEPREDVYF